MKKIFTAALLALVVFSGCYYDHADELYGGGTCNTTGINYSSGITEILNRYGCVGCHTGAAAGGGVKLDGYTAVQAAANNGSLWGAINHMPGFVAMPQGGNKMTQCDVNKIKAWIDAGKPQ